MRGIEAERFEPGDRPNIVLLAPEEPPYPGGLAIVGNTLLQATLTRDTLQADTARRTVMTAYQPDGAQRRVVLRGWVQVCDHDDAGMLLLGLADDLYPQVVMVDRNALLRRMYPVRFAGSVSRWN